MKQLLFAVSLSIISQAASADHFYCQITRTWGEVSARTEAEYRVMEAVADDTEFRCEGKIVGNQIVVTATGNNSGNSKTASNPAPQTTSVEIYGLSNQGDSLAYANCTCGLN